MAETSKFPGRPALRSAEIVSPVSVAPAVVDRPVTRSGERSLESAIAKNLLIHRGTDLPVDQFNVINNPVLVTGTPLDVIAFLVPIGYVLEIQAIAITYNDQLMHQGDWLSWRLAVNNSRVPYIGAQGVEFNPGAFGQVERPVSIGPVMVQTGNTAQLQVASFVAAFTAAPVYLVITARLQGILRQVTSGNEVNL